MNKKIKIISILFIFVLLIIFFLINHKNNLEAKEKNILENLKQPKITIKETTTEKEEKIEKEIKIIKPKFIQEITDDKIQILEKIILDNKEWIVKKNWLWYSNYKIKWISLNSVWENAQNFQEIWNFLEISPRLIASVCFSEKLRQSDSYRAKIRNMVDGIWVKDFLSFTKLHSFSEWLCSIKPITAIKVENHLKDKNSKYYLWEKYEHILDYDKNNKYTNNELVKYRLINDKWNIIYAGIILKMFESEWKNKWFDISKKPWILATLYNLWFYLSVPKANPWIWWAEVILWYSENKINKKQSFYYWEIAEWFYFSKIFPDISKNYEILNTNDFNTKKWEILK